MSDITAAKVKELREKSGAGMMDCKKALTEAKGDMDAAVDWLRTKGLATAAKKSGRAATEGLVAVATQGTEGVIVEINAETDFVARNEQFQDYVERVAQAALDTDGSTEAVAAADLGGKSVTDTLTDLIATIGENMSFRRSAKLSVGKGAVASYIHSALKPGLGKIGVLVALESEGDAATLEQLGKQIAMHVAATRPQATTVDELDPEIIEREKAVLIEQAKESGKSDDIAQKMVEGRIRKFYEEVVLLEQTYVIDGETKVKDVIAKAADECGGDVTLAGFVRFELGEGLEKKEEDFAEEVAKMAG